jgi:CRISPR-associated protein Csx3
VLLSRLCRQVGYEMYEMDIAVRNLLLRELKEQFGQEKLEELAEYLMDYVAQRLTGDDRDTQDLAQAQEWTALAYTKPGEAARELAEALSSRVEQQDMAEVLHLASLVETFAEPLVEGGFQPLLVYGRGMGSFIHGDLEGAAAQFSELLTWTGGKGQVAGVSLEIPRLEPSVYHTQVHRPIKLVLCGPPNSGKSCLREGLKQAILKIEGAPYPYVITACPDGEGAWFSEAAQRDLELGRKLKNEYKAKFTPEFAQLRASWLRNTTETLNIIDVGGKISPENRVIMAEATHAVILAMDMSTANAWMEFCRELNLQVIALIHSDYQGKADQIDTEEPLLTGSIHYLERGEDVSQRPMIQSLARKLVRIATASA